MMLYLASGHLEQEANPPIPVFANRTFDNSNLHTLVFHF